MATTGRVSGLVIQALRYIGQRHVDDLTVARLRKQLSENDKNQLLQDIRYVQAWLTSH